MDMITAVNTQAFAEMQIRQIQQRLSQEQDVVIRTYLDQAVTALSSVIRRTNHQIAACEISKVARGG